MSDDYYSVRGTSKRGMAKFDSTENKDVAERKAKAMIEQGCTNVQIVPYIDGKYRRPIPFGASPKEKPAFRISRKPSRSARPADGDIITVRGKRYLRLA